MNFLPHDYFLHVESHNCIHDTIRYMISPHLSFNLSSGNSLDSKISITKTILLFSVVVVAVYFFISLYFQVVHINVWRHDSIVMLPDYLGKLREEGRWINYFLFPILKGSVQSKY